MASDHEYVELLQDFKLRDEDLNATITELDLSEISTNISSDDWKRMNPYLDMKQIAVSDIEAAFKDPVEKRREYFMRWRKEKGSGASYKKIVLACLKSSNRSGAEDVLKWCKSQSKESSNNQGKLDSCFFFFVDSKARWSSLLKTRVTYA